MKIQQGFVSNSSSSSFIVISDKGNEENLKLPDWCENITPFVKGKRTFGWENEKCNDFFTKLNWVILQLRNKYTDFDYKNLEYSYYEKEYKEEYEKIKKIILEKCNLNLVYIPLKEMKDIEAYIDHQSTFPENENNLPETKNDLENFLFNEESYIQGGNDNG